MLYDTLVISFMDKEPIIPLISMYNTSLSGYMEIEDLKERYNKVYDKIKERK